MVTTLPTVNAEGVWLHGNTKYLYRKGGGAVADEYGKWFEAMARWQWFVTVTYNPEKLTQGFTQAGAGTAKRMLQDMLRRTEARSFVAVFERQSRGDYHVHALLAGCKAINGFVANQETERLFGMARYRIFNGKGAGAYLAKYLAKDMMELYIGLDTHEDWRYAGLLNYRS
jgi:hypothetical protein